VIRRLGLVAAIAAIVAADFPWGELQDHAHWYKVAWIPFISPPVRLRDVAENILLFVPLGVMLAVNVRRHVTAVTFLIATALACAGELTQVFSHGRIPSTTDIVCNVAGACAGAWLITRRRGGS
jgi:glycopeptide antibiotics resistance protein